MLAKRLIALAGLIVALLLLSLGTDVEYGEQAYFFPNLITYFLCTFALMLLISEGELPSLFKSSASFLWRWLFGIVGEGNPGRWPAIVQLIPMFIILFCYLYFADIIGLYICSLIAFFLIITIYTPVRPRSTSLIKNGVISLIFISVIYLIFSVLLQLQTPNALLI
jgi:hypothetical protein